jgi:hypothetical protein
MTEAEKMRMTDNLHDKRNQIMKKFKKHDTMTPLTANKIKEQTSLDKHKKIPLKKKRSNTEHGNKDTDKLIDIHISDSDIDV